MRTLRITSGPAAGESREIDGELVIGREGADLTIEDTELSRRHAALRSVERGVEVEDLGSLNGTFVNGQRVSDPMTLTASATLKLGTSEGTIEVSIPQVTRMAESPPDQPGDAPVAAPDVTVARSVQVPEEPPSDQPIPDPAVTAQRPVVQPDVTVQRPVAQPDVTVQRPVAQPDVTVQRPVAGPDVTVQRPVGSAGPPEGAAPPPAPPPTAAEKTGGSTVTLPVAWIVGGVVIALVLIFAALVLG